MRMATPERIRQVAPLAYEQAIAGIPGTIGLVESALARDAAL